MHEKLFHCSGSATRSVHKQSNQQSDGAADDQNGLNAAKARQVLPHKTNAVASAIVRLSDANLAACAVTQKSLNLHTFDAISQSSRKDEFHAVVRGACRTLGLTSLMLDLGFSVQAKLRTNKTAAKKTGTTTKSWTSATHPLFRTVVATINRTTEKIEKQNCIDTFN